MSREPEEANARMACRGGTTKPVRSHGEHMEECRYCSTRVSFDLVDHGFFGFRAGCPRAEKVEKAEGDRGRL